MSDLQFFKIEPCVLCEATGFVETKQKDFLSMPVSLVCPICDGKGELRVTNANRPNN